MSRVKLQTRAGRRVAAEIAERGPIPFRDFMDLTIFDPDVGYYARGRAGPGAECDYLTSPEIHSAFAVLVSLQIAEMWRHLGEPDPFWLVEAGPGSGAFIEDVLLAGGATTPRFAAALRIALIEASPTLRRHQEARLAALGARVRWLDRVAESAPALGPGCVFANEVLDALPFHRVVMTDAGLEEIYTDGDEAGLFDTPGVLSRPEIAGQIALGGGRLTLGQAGDVNLAVSGLLSDLARLVDPGYLLVLDYGEPATELYGARFPAGTLRCYWRHTRNQDPYLRVGLQDITAHVDLTAVTRVGESAGFQLIGATRQARFLERLGMTHLADQVDRTPMGRAHSRAHRAALAMLMDPRELGNLAALVFGRGVPPAPLRGFGGGPVLPISLPTGVLRLHSDPGLLVRSS